MEKIEQVAAAAVGFGIGWKGASIFTENDNLPTYDTKTQEIYENISFAYHTHIDSQKLPDTWKTDKEKQKIRPKKEATKLSNAIPYYKKMTMTLMKNQSEVVCKLYRHILVSIIELFESIKIKHNEQPESTWITWWNIKNYLYFFNYQQLAPLPEGPEIKFFVEIAEYIMDAYHASNEHTTIEKRRQYLEDVSKGPIRIHRKTDNDNVTTTLDYILEQYKELEKITKSRDLNKNIPQSIDDISKSILCLNRTSLNLTYRLLEGSKGEFEMDEFLNNDLKEANVTNQHSLGTKLNKVLKTIDMIDDFRPNNLNKNILNKIVNTILVEVEKDDSVLKHSKKSGIKDFFESLEEKQVIYNCTINILRDIFRLYFYAKNLHKINQALDTIGVNWMVTNQPTKLSIETQLKITKFTFERLFHNCKSYVSQYDKAIEKHRLKNKKTNDAPIYKNVHNAIVEHNFNNTSIKDSFDKGYKKITNLIDIKNSNSNIIKEENKKSLIKCYQGALESISLESDLEQEKYTETKQQLQNALIELSSNINKENNDSIPQLINDTLALLNKPDNETIEEAKELNEEHIWKSNVLKEIFENISCKYHSKSKKFMNCCNKIKKTIFNIETNKNINSICLNIVEMILRNFIIKNEKTCYLNPSIYRQPLQAINITGEKNRLTFINEHEQLSIDIGDKSNLELLGLQAQLMAEKLEFKKLSATNKELEEKLNQYTLNQPLQNNA